MLIRFDYPCDCENAIENLLENKTFSSRPDFPSLDIAEQENDTVVYAELAGLKKEDVRVTFEKNVLTISGKRKQDELSESSHSLLKEISDREFSRSVRFGIEVDAEKISAEMHDGILKIKLPKADAVKAREIHIQ